MTAVTRNEKHIEPIQFRTLSELTVSNLRSSIIRGLIQPGARITESELAETLNVSRNVVREAITILISEGLLIKERNRYTKVVGFTKEDVVDIFELRVSLEEAAVKRCMLNDDFCDKLEVYSNKIQANIENPGDYEELISADIEFHNYMIVTSGNKWLLDTWNRMIGPMELLLYMHMDNVQVMKSSHKSLINVIRSGDYQRICSSLEQHIGDTQQALLRVVK